MADTYTNWILKLEAAREKFPHTLQPRKQTKIHLVDSALLELIHGGNQGLLTIQQDLEKLYATQQGLEESGPSTFGFPELGDALRACIAKIELLQEGMSIANGGQLGGSINTKQQLVDVVIEEIYQDALTIPSKIQKRVGFGAGKQLPFFSSNVR